LADIGTKLNTTVYVTVQVMILVSNLQDEKCINRSLL